MDRHNQGPQSVPISAEDLLTRMRAGKKEVYMVRMGDVEVPIRVLSCDEVAAVRREAIRKQALSQGDETDRNLNIQKSTLMLASTVTQGSAPFLSEKLLSKMSLDELGFLYNEYVRIMENVNPSLDQIKPEVFRAIVDALKKNSALVNELSLLQLRAICLAYVDLILRQETQTSHQAS